MDHETFRQQAHEVVDWMADYLCDVGSLPVVPDAAPGSIRAGIPAMPPERAEPFARVMDDFRRVVLPGMTHWNHPGWFAYFPANNSPPSILAEMITAAIGAQCMSWQTSPAATELEQAVMGWLRAAIRLPPEFTGVIHDTASTATLAAIIAARERATGFETARRGAAAEAAPRLTVYASAEAHSSVEKAVRLAGLGLENLRKIGVDRSYAMDAAELEDAVAGDVEDGLVPCAVVATAGTTSSTAIDPLTAVAGISRTYGAWMHVDAAYAGAAMILPEKRALFDGIESADSVVINPHKWLLTNFDCTAFFVRDVRHLVATFGSDPEYLKTSHDGEVANLRDWGIPLGRRFRALKLWFVMRMYGMEGLRGVLRAHIAMAQELRSWVEAAPCFEVMAPSPFGLVCFRCNPGGDATETDALNEKILAAVNATGRVHLTHTRLGGRFTIRMSIGQRTTTREHVAEAWKIVEEASKDMRGRTCTRM